jgi:PadR family transcriptional regulator PadR
MTLTQKFTDDTSTSDALPISGDVLNAEVGSLYPALHRLEETGWICAEWAAKDACHRTRISSLSP